MHAAVDVGSGSVRSCLVSSTGDVSALSTHPISTSVESGFRSQSSTEIWDAVTACLAKTLLNALHISSLSFTAACSLVIVSESNRKDVILWMCHRAAEGTLGMNGLEPVELDQKLAIIAGTSSCHLYTCPTRIERSGVWGPYNDALISSMYTLEGSQTLTGKALEFAIETHPFFNEFCDSISSPESATVILSLNDHLFAIDEYHALTRNYHVLADFQGNRSPLADPAVSGCVSGLTLCSHSFDSLAMHYLATLQALCYGHRHIIQALDADIRTLVLSGGMCKNDLFLQSLADVTELYVIVGVCVC